MRLVDENRVEILRQKAILLERENHRLVEEVVRLKRALLEAQGLGAEQLQLELALLQDKLAAARNALEEEAKGAEEQRDDGEPNKTEPKTKPKAPGHGPREQPALPMQTKLHQLDPADQKCSSCGGELSVWEGKDDESFEIEVVERQFVITKHVRKKYLCRCGCMEMPELPPRLIPGGRYSNDVAIESATMKFVDQVPYDRIARIFGREGLIIDSQTVWDQVHALGRRLEPAWMRLREEALREPVLGVDQTHWKRIGQKKYLQMWALSTTRLAYFDIVDTKSAKDGALILKGFKGTAMCDAFSTHGALAKQGFILAHCWAHPRRDAEAALKSDAARAGAVIAFIRELYEIDKSAKGELERLRSLRDVSSRAVVDRLYEWIDEQRVLPSSPIAALLNYLRNHKAGFKRFLDDPRIPLDNNQTERGYLWPAVGRRAFVGSQSENGARTASIFYSLAESARRNALEPRGYFRTALGEALAGQRISLPHEIMLARRDAPLE